MIRLIIVSLVLFSNTVFAEPEIDTIQINHRLPQDILPEISAFLPADATARAFNNLIIIKAEPATIKEIKKLINQLDTPPQRLKLTLLKSALKISEAQHSSWQGNVTLDNDDVSGHVELKRWSTQTDDDLNAQYQAQGLAGLPIKINLGQLIPKAQQDIVLRFNGDVVVQNSTQYIPINNGFEAIASVLPNNQVSIEIYPQFSNYSERHGTINHSQLITTINGPASTWLELAQIDNSTHSNQENTGHYQTHQQQILYFYIKLEALNNN